MAEREAATSAFADRFGPGLAPPPTLTFPRGTATAAADRLNHPIEHIDDLRWRAFDEVFRKTPFDDAIDALPLRKPPLDIVQWETDLPPDKLQSKAARERFYRMSDRARAAAVRTYYRSGPHKLYARADVKRFYAMSQSARDAAVKAFYRAALPEFTRAGIADFVLIITPWAPTTEYLPRTRPRSRRLRSTHSARPGPLRRPLGRPAPPAQGVLWTRQAIACRARHQQPRRPPIHGLRDAHCRASTGRAARRAPH